MGGDIVGKLELVSLTYAFYCRKHGDGPLDKGIRERGGAMGLSVAPLPCSEVCWILPLSSALVVLQS